MKKISFAFTICFLLISSLSNGKLLKERKNIFEATKSFTHKVIKTSFVGCTYSATIQSSSGATRTVTANASGYGSNAADCQAAFNSVQEYVYAKYGVCIKQE